MIRWIASLTLFSLLSCCSPPYQEYTTGAESNSGFKPEFAKGFEVVSTDPVHIILYDLSHPGDTLKVIKRNLPANRFACMSTTHIAIFDQMGQLEKVKATGYGQFVKNVRVHSLINSGKIMNLTTGDEIDREVLAAASPDIFLVYPFGNVKCAAFEAMNISCVPVSEYLEENPLGRAEWIRMVGVLAGCSKQADSLFEGVKKNYLEALATVKKAGVDVRKKPEVFFASKEGDTWYAPPGNSAISHLINDAGGHYTLSDSISGGNISLPFEKLITTTINVNYWGNLVFSAGHYSLENARLEDTRLQSLLAFRNGNIFFCNTAEKDYFGEAMMQPDILLKDLISIFHPELLPEYRPTYFEKAK